MKIKILLALILASFFISCSHTTRPDRNPVRNEFKENKENFLKGIHNYFLSSLPTWANFSQTGKCRRSESIYYLDLPKLRNSFGISYIDSLQIQYSFNRKIDLLKETKAGQGISLRDEELTFYQAKEEILNGGHGAFLPPDYQVVNLIWIDPYLQNPDAQKRLKEILESHDIPMGHPVFISLCLSHSEIDRFINQLKLEDLDVRIISAEMFSIYDSNNKEGYFFKIDFAGFFKKEQKIYFLLPQNGKLPEEFIGKFEIKKVL